VRASLSSTSGGTELSWNPEGKAKLIQPGTSTEIQSASSSRAKSVSFSSSKKVLLPSGEIYTEMLQPEKKPPQLSITSGGKMIQPGVSTEIQPVSSSKAKPLALPPYQPIMAAQPTKPKSKNIFKKLIGKLKFKF
jgi:hypothetical protein